jgi:hypothetical protein
MTDRRDRFKLRLAVLPAVIGLAGVLVGAVATSGIAYLGDRNDRIADERAARRLVAAEVRLDSILLAVASDNGALNTQLGADVWPEQRATLARYLTSDDWNRIARFYADIATFNGVIGPPGTCVSERIRDLAREAAMRGVADSEVLDGFDTTLPQPNREDCS